MSTSGYENAPATRMLATHCAACGRPLVDSVSVEAGMGPDCREKYGYNQEAPAEVRAEINGRVHEIAAGCAPGVAIGHVLCIRAHGFDTLADKLEQVLCAVEIEEVSADLIAIATPYRPDFAPALKSAIKGWARFDGETKRWLVPAAQQSRNAAWRVLREFFAGSIGKGPRGLFVIEAVR